MTARLSSLLGALALEFLLLLPLAAQEHAVIPGYFDLRRRLDRPDTSRIRQIRFLTENDYPPFHFIGPDGALTGFEVELARALCEQLGVSCTIQARRWDGLPEALRKNEGDAIIAAFRITAEARQKFLFTLPYHKTPARFVTQRASTLPDADMATLKGQKVGVVAGSSHEAYLKAFFREVQRVAEIDTAAVLTSIRAGSVALGFVDGVTAAFWLNGETSANCCRFLGGAYTESRFFGEGAGIAVRPDNAQLQAALDWGLQRLTLDGVYATLYLKYFPVGFY